MASKTVIRPIVQVLIHSIKYILILEKKLWAYTFLALGFIRPDWDVVDRRASMQKYE